MKSKTKIDKQSLKKGNPLLVETIRAAKKTGSDFWLKVAGILAGPRREWTEINLNDIEKSSKEGDSVVFPGKVLSQGEISKKLAVIAGYIVLHDIAFGIQERYFGIGQNVFCAVGPHGIANSLQVVVHHPQVGIVVHEGVDVIIAFSAFSVAGKEAAVDTEEEDAKIVCI